MSESTQRPRWATAAVLLGAGVAAGIIGASAFGASAESSAPSGTSSSGTSSAPTGSGTSSSGTGTSSAAPSGRGDHDGDGPHGGGPGGSRGDEKAVTSAQATTLKAAALAKVPGGTVERVETDSGDAAYEVHMTDKTGKRVTVKFDKNLTFTAVEDGMGK